MKISVITPAYNRAYILPQCYASLKAQTNKSFEWIVVDDGSNDDTETVVADFMSEGAVDIKYIKQANGGKHRAHNAAVIAAKGHLTVCLDSDDALAPNAIERIINEWSKLQYTNIIGVLALRGDFKSYEPICSRIPKGVNHATMTALRDRYGFEGDTVLFFKTDVLKANLFREFTGENFLTENNLYSRLDRLGEMLLLDEVLYYCEYLPDGLTAKYHSLLYRNPKGTADTYYLMSQMADSFGKKLKYAIVAEAYKSIVDDTSELDFSQNKALMRCARILAPLYRLKYFRNVK